eukprot:CAMPEP_0194144836 /NCGR_PEP_ID=MMETSP0152-20130528/13839_1 /TAXON_ID=1049557 /ORGANISM="Thalassiothrix antarctica, Strain L6-D1" /LENGTH=364 /DNA_ID=CAMNT_0038844849 /DNA_START=6 /DNA_END=1100 /DNA_ORIENTATION=-
MSSISTASVIVVGCGCPGRSMGHYHCYQILEQTSCPSTSLKYVVEPWYMSKNGKSSAGGDIFETWREATEKQKGIKFFQSVEEVPACIDGERRMAIISARTSENPQLFTQCLSIGCHTIYLEKPGAPSVTELENMRDRAKEKGITVLMGFNKNVAKYSTKTMEKAKKTDHLTFVHNNNYKKEDLNECFERNSEGILKNMAIHELALMVTFYGVTTETICEVDADKEFSSFQTLVGPSGKEYSDFDKIKFTITTKNGVKVSIAADRCGGDDSIGILTDESGTEIFRHSMPDNEDLDKIKELEEKNPGAMPYFYVQDRDYAILKERIARNCIDGSPAEGVATIDVAVETLKLAEYLTPVLQKQLLN